MNNEPNNEPNEEQAKVLAEKELEDVSGGKAVVGSHFTSLLQVTPLLVNLNA